MLNQPSVIHALEGKKEQFHAYSARQRQQQQRFEERLTVLSEMDLETILAKLSDIGEDWPGARPTTELDQAIDLCLSFENRWDNHQEARAWARDVLQDRATIAVDGSQIVPSTDYLPLVGATQIGWFINEHRADGRYVKDLSFQVLTPDELGDDGDGDDESMATQTINQVRFVGECDRLCELMEARAAMGEADASLFFFDGSFIISFAGKIRETRAAHYIDAILKLLEFSKRYRSPLIGFVDSSRSRDVITLINTLSGGSLTVSDGLLLSDLLPNWGDRTPLFTCARRDGLSSTNRAAFYNDVVFCYMRLSRDRPPARIEMPMWLHQKGLTDKVLDIVRAECVIGAGYPYAIETADALAVISQQDRRRFHRLWQRFMEKEGLRLTQTRKSQSKRTRR